MPDFDDDDMPDPDSSIRQLRAKAKQADVEKERASEAERKLAALQRENAFMKAGIDLTDARAAYFVKGYDGDLDPAAIRAEAESAGFLAAPEPVVAPDEASAWDRTASASAGAVPNPPDQTLNQEMLDAHNRGDIRSADDLARFLGSKDPSLVAWDGGPIPATP